MTDMTVTTEPPQGNQPEVRELDGTLKDQSIPENTTPTLEKKPEGQSFLTQKSPEPKEPEKVEPKLDADGKPIVESKKEEPVAGAPEKYADFKVPEGFKFDDKALGEAQATFKELNLTQDQAQKLIDTYSKVGREATEAPYKAWANLQKEWMSDIADRFGSKSEAIRTDISKAIDSALPPSLARSFRSALDLTGAGSNPDVVEALSIMFKPFVEGPSIRPGGLSPEANKPPGAPVAPSLAEALYPHLVGNRGGS